MRILIICVSVYLSINFVFGIFVAGAFMEKLWRTKPDRIMTEKEKLLNYTVRFFIGN